MAELVRAWLSGTPCAVLVEHFDVLKNFDDERATTKVVCPLTWASCVRQSEVKLQG